MSGWHLIVLCFLCPRFPISLSLPPSLPNAQHGKFVARTFAQEMTRIVDLCVAACHEDPSLFVSVLKHKRSIKNGAAQRMIWCIAMSVLRQLAPDHFRQVLEWSMGSGKDLLRLHRVHALATPDAISTVEMRILAEKIVTYVAAASKHSDMLFKFVPSEGGHFHAEYVQLLASVNELLPAALTAVPTEPAQGAGEDAASAAGESTPAEALRASVMARIGTQAVCCVCVCVCVCEVHLV
jgi:hypothetical protein